MTAKREPHTRISDYDSVLAVYEAKFRQTVPVGVLNHSFIYNGRPLIRVLLKKALARGLPVSGSEWHQLVRSWSRTPPKLRRMIHFIPKED